MKSSKMVDISSLIKYLFSLVFAPAKKNKNNK